MNRVKLITKDNRVAIDLGEFGIFYPKDILSFEILDTDFNSIISDILIIK